MFWSNSVLKILNQIVRSFWNWILHSCLKYGSLFVFVLNFPYSNLCYFDSLVGEKNAIRAKKLFFLYVCFWKSYLEHTHISFTKTHICPHTCSLADHTTSCRLRLPFVCERHNITSVEKNPLKPQPDGLPCEKNSLSFRNKVCSFNTL